jgi:hypothetical protein
VQGEKQQVHCMSAIHKKGKYTVDLKKMLIFQVRGRRVGSRLLFMFDHPLLRY